MKKILIIEDSVELQESYKKLLTAEGMDVSVAGTGQQGLDALEAQKPDLILLDIMLTGGMNGFDVLERIKQNDRLKEIPVIVLTNLDTERESGKKIGAADYLVKANTSIDELLKIVKEHLGV